MAIFDSEKRPRGLRVPSLTAMKSSAAAKSQFSFHSKKSTESVPSDDSTPKTAPPFPPPAKPAPPPDKELPSPPKEAQAPNVNPYFPPIPSPRDGVPERRPIERVPVPGPTSALSPISPSQPRTTGMRTQPKPQPQPQPDPNIFQQAPAPIPVPAPVQAREPIRAQAPPVTLSPPDSLPAQKETTSPALEDFIPTPDSTEPPLDVPAMAPRDLAPSPFVPPEVEPVAPNLNKVHFQCHQEHRNMPVAQNVWCPMPCFACQKFDNEVRHRCVFCCLRVCEECYQTLQKCKNRSLEELLERVA
ncbi:hypothetical protein PENANT_c049G07162 [Penicillium antarcticum]|uniref:Uncharacterized protein n=1 Tax=Penicillium antarcticum TaxID=416450 RepID=A0A1V6PSQ0_9EURO|nr:uncharacterized protein N7508_003721 [Penicillium antarcticum]KAJ5312891.1 hypothetical protein N7508_003721 [Penicillium antarcticum]OQD79526.1 hypothetical protein PENANT_c049G07162 [Penicillium antarcticum]